MIERAEPSLPISCLSLAMAVCVTDRFPAVISTITRSPEASNTSILR